MVSNGILFIGTGKSRKFKLRPFFYFKLSKIIENIKHLIIFGVLKYQGSEYLHNKVFIRVVY